MAVGTDKEIMGSNNEPVKSGRGRPKLNRELALLLFKAGFSNSQVAKRMKCHPKQAGRMRRELIGEGKLEAPDSGRTTDHIVHADFDEECTRATGFSFYDWITTKQPSKGRYCFNFCRMVWEEIWDRPSLVIATRKEDPLGDQIALKFMKEFGEDSKRLRTRLKKIRRLFAFLGRGDIEDKHLTMDEKRAPREIRKVPAISFPSFPQRLEAAINAFEAAFGFIAGVWLRVKMTTGIRTGLYSDGRGLMALTADPKQASYIIFEGDSQQSDILEKMGERWTLNWLPSRVFDELKTLYDAALETEDKRLFPWSEYYKDKLSKSWKEIAEEHTGIEDLSFHDLRKVSITYLYAMEIPLEIATSINVGWKDLSTASDHYLQLRRSNLMKRSDRKEYRDNIPEWYKDGLDEFRRDEAITRVGRGRF